MRTTDRLNVWYQTSLVGSIRRETTGTIGFQYDPKWLNTGFAISQQLPLQIDEFSPSEKLAHRFFANLLPEASARLHIVRDMKLADSDFELLNHLGGECAGALTILPIESKPNNKLDYKKLCGTDLTKLLEQKGAVYNLSLGNELPRLSLAGAQDKCPIYFDGIDYFQPQDVSPSTHILKFELADYRHVPVYEYFMAQLASTINLPVVECQLENVEGS